MGSARPVLAASRGLSPDSRNACWNQAPDQLWSSLIASVAAAAANERRSRAVWADTGRPSRPDRATWSGAWGVIPGGPSAWRWVLDAEETKEAEVHGTGGIFDGHPPGFDLVFGSTADGHAGSNEPGGRDTAVEVAAFLPALDDLMQPFHARAVPVEVFVGADRGHIFPEERVAGAHLPAGVEQPDQRLGRRCLLEPGRLERRRHLGCGLLDDGVQQRLAGGEVGVDGLPADPGSPGDVLDARLWLRAQDFGGRLQDRGDVLLGIRPPTPAPGLRFR